MRVAVIGSRGLRVPDLEKYLPAETTAIISGGARGVDTSAKEYAQANGIELIEYLPQYEKYGRAAPLRRNLVMIEDADYVIAFWDGSSHGTEFVIEYCKKNGQATPGFPVDKVKRREQHALAFCI